MFSRDLAAAEKFLMLSFVMVMTVPFSFIIAAAVFFV